MFTSGTPSREYKESADIMTTKGIFMIYQAEEKSKDISWISEKGSENRYLTGQLIVLKSHGLGLCTKEIHHTATFHLAPLRGP